MNVLMAAPEVFPYAKTGGLADAAASLAAELARTKHKVLVVLPFYRTVKERFPAPSAGGPFEVRMGGVAFAGMLRRRENVVFIECDRFYDRPELYGTASGDYPDNPQRFVFFSRAVFEAARLCGFRPDIIHCHDWQAGLAPVYLKTVYGRDPFFAGARSVLTIHNMGYQGVFPAEVMRMAGLPGDLFNPEGVEFYGKMNFLKAGIIWADSLTTVSPTYANQIQTPEHGFGLDGVLRKRAGRLRGIANGIDDCLWNPARDRHIPENYSPGNDLAGKAACKKKLSSLCGFKDPARPLVSFVGRLSYQKGADIAAAVAGEAVSEGVNLLFLGKGDERYQRELEALGERYPGGVYVRVGFDEEFSHLVYAGSDIFLMPSRYEPCGLGQMIALRYGTPPVAADTGGISDTVRNYLPLSGDGTGFLFPEASPGSLRQSLWYALCVHRQAERWEGVIRNGMSVDFSWRKPAARYLEIYKEALGQVPREKSPVPAPLRGPRPLKGSSTLKDTGSLKGPGPRLD
ncbi:MAG: glycogen synthase GlgA [Nitrospiraceae bacterium]|nr:glycogen synthase GlgA [Nitrospiraceae bacterium]